MTAPLFFTLVRLIGSFTLVPFILLYVPQYNNLISHIVPVVGMLFLSITDYLDGYLARLYHQETSSGAFLDQIADKFFVAISLICFTILGQLSIWLTLFFILREVGITVVRLLAKKNHMRIVVSHWGKWKSTFQYLYLINTTLVIAVPSYETSLNLIGTFFLIGAVVLSFWSAVQYMSLFLCKWSTRRSC